MKAERTNRIPKVVVFTARVINDSLIYYRCPRFLRYGKPVLDFDPLQCDEGIVSHIASFGRSRTRVEVSLQVLG